MPKSLLFLLWISLYFFFILQSGHYIEIMCEGILEFLFRGIMGLQTVLLFFFKKGALGSERL